MDLTELGQFAVAMVTIVNPIGAVPVFLSMTDELTHDQRKHMTRACAIAVFVTIATSILIGEYILKFFGISIASFSIGGGILIFTMALNMIKARNVESKLSKSELTDSSLKEVGIVPLAIPLLSGPGAISTSIIYSQKFTPYELGLSSLVIAALSFFVYLSLSRAVFIRAKLGNLGVNVMTRVMGLILLAMAIETILGGIKEIMPILKG